MSVSDTLIYSLPIALHFGWTTAASLVNLNGSASYFSKTLTQKTRNIIGHVSVGLATCVGLFITIQRRAPIYGGVIAWALSAVADSMNQRLLSSSTTDGDQGEERIVPDKKSILIQRFLCKMGALMNIFAMAFVTELGFVSWNHQRLNSGSGGGGGGSTSSSLSSF
jgi:nitrate reductase NapE component